MFKFGVLFCRNCILFIYLVSFFNLSAQNPGLFTNVSAVVLPGISGISESSVAWGDYDNDNDLDFILTGTTAGSAKVSQIWRNGTTGSTGAFSNVTASIAPGLPGVNESTVSWGDYDNDNDLDILLIGNDMDDIGILQIWKNNISGSSGAFVKIETSITQLYGGSGAWGDYDNDGDLDIVASGVDEAALNIVTLLWKNEGNGNFTKVDALLPGVTFHPAISWNDYDSDGDLDLLLAGTSLENNSLVRVADIWKNHEGSFIAIGAGLTPVNGVCADWADYDNDGDPDLILAGYDGNTGVTELWKNNNGTLEKMSIVFPALETPSVKWGDYDNDGAPDLILSGYTGTHFTQIWKNSAGTFSNINAVLPKITDGNSTWADFDNDHDLDVLFTGESNSSGRISQLFRNENVLPNSPPQKPTGLSAESTGNNISLKWLPVTDNTTPQAAITYHVRVGTTASGNQVASPMANTSTGYRKVVATGNSSYNTEFNLRGLAPGQYYWSVQAVDHSFEGGLFSSEGTFTIINPAPAVPAVITFENANAVYGDADMTPAASSTNHVTPMTYTSSAPATAAIVNGKIKILKAGSVIITATQEGSDHFLPATKSMTLTISKKTQSLTFNALPDKKITDLPFELTATASSGLPITYTSLNTDIVRISNNVVTIVGAGVAPVTASQAGNENYKPASGVLRSITIVNRAPVVVKPIADQKAIPRQPFFFAVDKLTFDDPDKENLRYSATLSDGTALPSWIVFNEAALTFQGTPSTNDRSITIRMTAKDEHNLSVAQDFKIQIDVVMGIETISDNDIDAYPIPTHDVLYVDAKSFTIKSISIRSALGDLILHEEYSSGNSRQAMDLFGFEDGLYLVEIRTSEGVKQVKVVKK